MSLFPPKPTTYELLCWLFVQLEAWLQERKTKRIEKEAQESTAAALNEWFQTPKGKHFLAQKKKVGGNFSLFFEQFAFYPGGCGAPAVIYEVRIYGARGLKGYSVKQIYWAN